MQIIEVLVGDGGWVFGVHFLQEAFAGELESIVKMVVLSPLLEPAGSYNPPFRVAGEVGVQVTAKSGDEVIQEPRYGLSNTFSLLNRGNDLHRVVQIFKRLGQLVA